MFARDDSCEAANQINGSQCSRHVEVRLNYQVPAELLRIKVLDDRSTLGKKWHVSPKQVHRYESQFDQQLNFNSVSSIISKNQVKEG
jgi:hypothetical protein